MPLTGGIVLLLMVLSISASPRLRLQWAALLLLRRSTSTDPLLLLLLKNSTATTTRPQLAVLAHEELHLRQNSAVIGAADARSLLHGPDINRDQRPTHADSAVPMAQHTLPTSELYVQHSRSE